MQQLTILLQDAYRHPTAAWIAASVVLLYVIVATYKSKTTRELDRRLKQMRSERGDLYGTVRAHSYQAVSRVR